MAGHVVLVHGNLTVARILRERGDLPGALAAITRRGWFWHDDYVSTFFREEGRIAAEIGALDQASEVYRAYLTLRSNPEASLRPAVEPFERSWQTCTVE